MSLKPVRSIVSSAVVSSALAAASLLTTGCFGPPPTERKAPTIMPEKPKMPSVPPRVATPIDADLQQRAGAQIAAAFTASSPVLRAQALEATSRTNDPAASDRILRGLTDADPLVRFAAAMCAGDLKNRSAFAALRAAATDSDVSVRVAVRYALHQLGDTSMSHDLEALSQSPNAHVRGNVATVLGLLKEPSGVALLRPMLADPDEAVRLQVAEAMWRLGSEQGLENLVAGTVSPFPDEQIICILALAGPRDQRTSDYIMGKLAVDKDNKQYPEVQLAAARALGMLGNDAGFGVAIGHVDSTDPRQRALAALALGDIGRTDGQSALAKLLNDPSGDVKLAAATALRQIGMRR